MYILAKIELLVFPLAEQFQNMHTINAPLRFSHCTFIVQDVDDGAGVGAGQQSLLGLVDGQQKDKIFCRF